MLKEARPAGLSDDTLTLEFPPAADFHRKLAEEPKHAGTLADALYEVTGRRLSLAFAVGEQGDEPAEPVQPSEEELVSMLKETFDAREIED